MRLKSTLDSFCVVVFDSSIFPPHGSASLCFGNMCLTAMTHTSLNKIERNQTQIHLSVWSSFTQNRARLLNSLPVMLCDAVNSSAKVHVMAKVGLLHRGHFSIPCLSDFIHLVALLLFSVDFILSNIFPEGSFIEANY